MDDGSRYFGDRLRELREAAGLSQQQLATLAGMSMAGLAMLEQGKRAPGWNTACALADALKCSVETFRQPPMSTEKPAPGRPKKAASDEPAPAAPKKGKGKK